MTIPYKKRIVMKYFHIVLIRKMYDDNSDKPDEFVVLDYSKSINRFNPSKMGRIIISGFDLEETTALFKDYIKNKDKYDEELDTIDDLEEA